MAAKITLDLGTRDLADGSGPARFTLEIDLDRMGWLLDHIEEHGGYTTLADRAFVGRRQRVSTVCRNGCRAVGADSIGYSTHHLCVRCNAIVPRTDAATAC